MITPQSGDLLRSMCSSEAELKELRHNILRHYFDGLKYGKSVGKPKNKGLLRKKTPKR